MVERLYLTAPETATALRISVATLYAYVSRGMIRSQRVPGSKRRLYWRADVEKLKGGEDPASGDALPTSLVDRTSITLLTAEGYYYRGRSALEMARTETLEATAAHLWQADEAQVFRSDLPAIPKTALKPRGKEETIWQRTMKMLFAVEQADPRAYDLTREGYCRSGADALRCVTAACLDATQLSAAPIHELIAAELGADRRFEDVLRQYLVLAADHELDPTTYAVRAAANTGVTPYAAITAGLLTSSGRRLVFGRTGSITRLFEELDVARDPRESILSRVRAGETVPGFGSTPYPATDPRAAHLLQLLETVCAGEADFDGLLVAIKTVHEATGSQPSFVIPALFLERKLGLRTEQTTLLRVARVVGWIAHAMEQYFESDLVRPHAAFSGILPAPEL
jgi:citrate synthase